MYEGMKNNRIGEDEGEEEEMEVEEKEKEVRKDDCDVLEVINDGLGVLTSHRFSFCGSFFGRVAILANRLLQNLCSLVFDHNLLL